MVDLARERDEALARWREARDAAVERSASA
jgi:hypothetical protein